MSDDSHNNPDPLRTVRLLWDPPPGPARGPRRSLNIEDIVAAAVQLADTRGTASLSMRQVAAAVGCGTMSLYTYISSKAELLEFMVDHAYAELPAPNGDGPWQDNLRFLAHEHFQLCLRHPWILESNLVRLSLGPNFLTAQEHLYAQLEQAAMTPENIVRSARLLTDYVHGAARSTLLDTEAAENMGTDPKGFQHARDEFWNRWFDLDRFPVHTRLWTFGALTAETDTFSFGLDRLLQGLTDLSKTSS